MEINKYHAPHNIDADCINDIEARSLFNDAYEEHLNGRFKNAINLFQKSIDNFPSAQAYTYMAWSYASIKEYEKSIELCKTAIKIDPKYGNPYNDIGAYLIIIGNDDEAIEWLKKAVISPFYNCKFYSYYNLGKIYQDKNQINKAISCYKKSTEINPDFDLAKKAYDKMLRSIN